MGDGGAILDGCNLEASSLEGADCGLATGARALDEDCDLAHAMLHGHLCGLLCSHLSCKGSGLAAALEANGTGRLPGDNVAAGVSDADDGVVERALDVSLSNGDVLAIRTADTVF